MSFSISDLVRITGLPYMTVSNQMKQGYCAWPRRIRDNRSDDPAYRCWENMISRCNNPKATGYKNYGGRGISVYPEWQDFMKFINYIGPRPSLQHSIDRINVNGNYEPGNVRWATDQQQARNSRNYKRGRIDLHGRKYRAKLGDILIGFFTTKEEARVALDTYIHTTERK